MADDRVWKPALALLKQNTGVPMVFGGTMRSGVVRLSQFDGARTGALDGVLVREGKGVGGRVWRESAVVMVEDYGAALDISHDYDSPVRSEGLRTVVGAPVLMCGTLCGILYAGTRGGPTAGDRLRDSVQAAARSLARELAIEAEVDRRVARRRLEEEGAATALRRAHAELRSVVAATDDPATRERLEVLAAILVDDARTDHVLTPRQVDVLALVATGASYGAVGTRLGLSAQTVKSYMRDLLAMLGAHSRHEAVVEARRLRLIA